jgi:hypothetical protein
MRTIIFTIFSIAMLSSCRSFSEINSLAMKSSESLKEFKSLEYNFTVNCNETCYQRALEDKRFALAPPTCDCAEEKKTDKNVKRLFTVLDTYFKGLQRLSNDKLVKISFDIIADPLTENQFIKEADIKPFINLSQSITTMITNKYRAKQLNTAIEKANPDVLLLLEKIQQIIEQNLVPTLTNKRGELQQVYLEIFSDSLNSNYDRFMIKDRYFKELNAITNKESELLKYSKSLNKIAKGHQLLYDNRNNLDKETTKNAIVELYTELSELMN